MREKYYKIDRWAEELRYGLEDAESSLLQALEQIVNISWIHHDCALEGVVYSFEELKEAIEKKGLGDLNGAPLCEEIVNHHLAIEFVREQAKRKRHIISGDTIKKIHSLLACEGERGGVYRKDIPVHKLYFQDVCPPERIPYRMRKLVEFISSPEAKRHHPIKLVSKIHFRFMAIYPFSKDTGKVGRLLMNLILMRLGYQPAIIHSVERQRYYEAIRTPHRGLGSLICEALENSIVSMQRFLQEEVGARRDRVAL